MTKPTFDAINPDMATVRQIVFRRLRAEPDWDYIQDDKAKSFESYVEFAPPRPDDAERFMLCVFDVLWELVLQGVIVPGKKVTSMMTDFPRFHRTDYGRSVLAQGEYVPHDPTGYPKAVHYGS
jgi:hypothetical protein